MTEPVQALKPCPTPWCQSSDEIELTGYRGVDMFVVCGGCGVQGPGGIRTEAKAITAWNTRPIETNSRTGDVGEMFPETVKQDQFNALWDRHVLAEWGGVNEFAKVHTQQSAREYKRGFQACFAAQSITPPEVGGELVERVARAICRAWYYCDLDKPDGINHWNANKARCTKEAEAAIAILSTPEVVDGTAGLVESLEYYADQFCELSPAHEACGKLSRKECSGCDARAALSQHRGVS